MGTHNMEVRHFTPFLLKCFHIQVQMVNHKLGFKDKDTEVHTNSIESHWNKFRVDVARKYGNPPLWFKFKLISTEWKTNILPTWNSLRKITINLCTSVMEVMLHKWISSWSNRLHFSDITHYHKRALIVQFEKSKKLQIMRIGAALGEYKEQLLKLMWY